MDRRGWRDKERCTYPFVETDAPRKVDQATKRPINEQSHMDRQGHVSAAQNRPSVRRAALSLRAWSVNRCACHVEDVRCGIRKRQQLRSERSG